MHWGMAHHRGKAMEKAGNLLTLYNDVSTTPIDWLWFPYIAIGKITLLQGDPSDGKSTMMIQLLAALSTGSTLPDGAPIERPLRAIYQCSEDNAADTIKPRLEAAGADCRNIAFINEEIQGYLTLDDERLCLAIIDFRPSIVVIDPIQSYIENASDLQIAGRIRKLLRRIGMWASAYNCAIVLISHLNKNESTKLLYRSLGSIDVVAAARSVLQVERDKENPNLRIVRQIKNNLGKIGEDIQFEISPEHGFQWKMRQRQVSFQTIKELSVEDLPKSKQERTSLLLKNLLSEGAMESKEIQRILNQYGIGNKTMQNVKALLGIKSYRKMRKWYWIMPAADHDKARK